jgi:hypothetical protein
MTATTINLSAQPILSLTLGRNKSAAGWYMLGSQIQKVTTCRSPDVNGSDGASLREQLRAGDKSLAGNKGYWRYLKIEGEGHFAIDEAKLVEEAGYDGTWVLRNNTDLPTASVALQFKKLFMVNQWFRSCESLLEIRPIYHRSDETIRGHVFCSFLALALRHALQARLEPKGPTVEWARVLQDLQRVRYIDV